MVKRTHFDAIPSPDSSDSRGGGECGDGGRRGCPCPAIGAGGDTGARRDRHSRHQPGRAEAPAVRAIKPDDKQQMSRISFQRNTPEGWQDTIKRMVALNGLTIEPAVAREVVKYLSDSHGLAPEEAKPVAYEVERRVVVDEQYTASGDLQGVCNACHSLGRVRSQRRTRNEWELLINDAPRLVSAHGPSGLPAHGTRAARPWAGRPSARHPSPFTRRPWITCRSRLPAADP
jgi:hypothetical protein